MGGGNPNGIGNAYAIRDLVIFWGPNGTCWRARRGFKDVDAG